MNAGSTLVVPINCLFDILQHFADPFDSSFHFHDIVRNSHIVGLGANCVDLTVHLLAQELQFPSQRSISTEKRIKLLKM